MKKILLLIVIIAAPGLGYWALSRPEVISVRLATVDTELAEATVANTRAGTIKACNRSRLSLPFDGQVDELLVDEGDRVKKGQLLLRLWNADQHARVKDARAKTTINRTALSEACDTAVLEKRELKRIVGLALIGLLAGLAPARRAARLNPIDALRSE